MEKAMIYMSSAQCRAARALLEWSQEELAQNAQVARATIADFERNTRTPIRNNLIAIAMTFEAAGIAFIPENGGGAGVRFRKVELEYTREVREASDGIIIRVRYFGSPYRVLVPYDVIEDLYRENPRKGEYVKAVERRLPTYLRAIEGALANGLADENGELCLTHMMFPEEAF
ncbi:MAG: helix-turn-helix transcriptional regulator [Parvibaculaceae bacterium]|nr:helix-turn-helix transcriptional regulator [Parvibaculaceae bacterium]